MNVNVARGKKLATVTLVAAVALALSGCGGGGDDDKQSTDPKTSAPAEAAAAPSTESGFFFLDVTKDVKVGDKLSPTANEIIVPAGILEITEVQEIESIEPGAAQLPATEDDETIEEYVPADGEVFRIFDLEFTPSDNEAGSAVATDLSLELDGTETHVTELSGSDTIRLLVSVDEKESGSLVVSADGHDQSFDLLTGERAEDDVAAAYYLDTRVQEPNHQFEIAQGTFEAVSATGNAQSLSTNFAFTVVKAELTAWSEADGWADPGKAWLAVTWSHDLSLDGGVGPQITSISATLAITADSAKATDEVTYQETFRESEERVINVSVPVDVTSADFSVSGSYSVNQPNGSGLSIPGNNAGEFASETTTVSFN